MPWCDDCAKFWTPTSMPPDGTCPTCGDVIAEPPDSQRAPWHFYVLIVGVVVYLGWRAVQGFQWLVRNDHANIAIIIGAVLVALTAWGVVWFLRREPAPEDAGADVGADGE